MSIDTVQNLVKKRNLMFICILAISLVLSGITYLKYKNDIASAKEVYIHDKSADTKHQAELIEQRFKYFYQGLRTMSLVPGVRNLDRYGKNLTPDTKVTLQQIYNNAYLNVNMSEIYLLPDSIDPDKIDVVTKKNQEPIMTFDEFIVAGAKKDEGDEEAPKLEEVEIHEYRLMKTQLEYLSQNFPTMASFKDIEVPAVMGPNVVTCDNAEFSQELLDKGDDFNRLGFIYTLPVYDNNKKFKGAISGVLRTKVLQDSLPKGEYGIFNKTYKANLVNEPKKAFSDSLAYFEKGQTNPNLIYSEVVDLNIIDNQKWQLFSAADNAEFYELPVVQKTKVVFWGGLLGQLFISLLVGYFTWVSFKNQIELEKKVLARTKDLFEEKKNSQVLLDNAAQGFLSFSKDGLVHETYSKVCLGLLGLNPAGKKIATCLNQKEDSLDELTSMLFEETIDFDSMAGLFPSEITINEKIVAAQIKPIRNQENKVEKIMCVLSDLTEIKKIEAEQVKERNLHNSLVKIMKSPDDINTAYELIEELVSSKMDPVVVKRALHTLKGTFAFLGMFDIAEKCHQFEDQMKDKYSPEESVTIAELIKSDLDQFIDKYNDVLKIQRHTKKITVEVSKLDNILSKLSQNVPYQYLFDEITDLKHRPLNEALNWMSDVFQTTAEQSGKEVAPIEFKRTVNLDSDAYNKLFKSFVHIARNSADHGIEAPDIREINGKSEPGKMTIDSWEEKDKYFISFKDNGGGIDLEKLRLKAKEKNIKVTNTDIDAYIIFESGLSTKDEVSHSSGRGVGLDAVRSEALKLGGSVTVVNSPDQGLEIIVSFKKINSAAKKSTLAA